MKDFEPNVKPVLIHLPVKVLDRISGESKSSGVPRKKIIERMVIKKYGK